MEKKRNGIFGELEDMVDTEDELMGEGSNGSEIESEEEVMGEKNKEKEMGKVNGKEGTRWKNRKDMTTEERKERNKQEKLRKRRKKYCRKCGKMGHNPEQCGKHCTKCNKWGHQRKMCRVVKEGNSRKGK